MLTDDQKREFKELGFIVLPNAIDPSVVKRARKEVKNHLPMDEQSFQELSQKPDELKERVQKIQDLDSLVEIDSQLESYASALVGDVEPLGDEIPISLNYPEDGQVHSPEARQPSDLEGHIDGYPQDYSVGDGLEHAAVYALCYLDRVRPMGGGFTLWPGSHWNAQEYFGDHSIAGGQGGIPAINEDGTWDYDRKRHDQFDPFEATGDAGTVVLAHYKMEHADGLNLSPDPRIAQLRLFTQPDMNEQNTERAATNIWAHWPEMEDVETNDSFTETVINRDAVGDETEDVVIRME